MSCSVGIDDITSHLFEYCFSDTSSNQYNFLCNPSLQHWKKNMFLVTFRLISYALPRPLFQTQDAHGTFHTASQTKKEQCHPWKMWDNGYKFFSASPDQFYLFRPWTFQKPYLKKYRKYLSSDHFLHLTSKKPSLTLVTGQEWDSTGLALVEYTDSQWKIIAVENLFQNDMNQDTRFYRHPTDSNEFLVTYNGFLHHSTACSNILTTQILQRRLIIIESSQNKLPIVYVSEEKPFLYRNIQMIEKNCIYHRDNVMYSLTFHSGLTIQTPQENIVKPCVLLETLKQILHKQFGQSVPLPSISLGSPPLFYEPTGRFIMTCHLKVPYRDRHYSNLLPFLDWRSVYKHGKFIYFLFFIEFTSSYEITRLSSAFIPTDKNSSHAPFLLCFSTGLTRYGDKYILSYGEGDVRTKLFTFTSFFLENMLYTNDELMILDRFPFELLSTDIWNQTPRIDYYGYFNQRNVGDDAFVVMYRYFHRKAMICVAPEKRLLFRFSHDIDLTTSSFSSNIRTIILGGGDIINPFFMEKIGSTSVSIHAVSVGIPYLDSMHFLKKFDSVVLRNALDYHSIKAQNILPSSVHLMSFPDLVFGFYRFLSTPVHFMSPFNRKEGQPHIGLNICRTYYERESFYYVSFIQTLSSMLEAVLDSIPDTRLYSIPFCTPSHKHVEDDRIIHQHVHSFLQQAPISFEWVDVFDSHHFPRDVENVHYTLRCLQQMDFLICTRFHAHIFALVAGVPFVSLAPSRKCRQLLQELHLTELSFPFEVTANDHPRPIQSPQKLAQWIIEKYHQRENIRHKIHHVFHNTVLPHYQNFEKYWQRFLIHFTTSSLFTIFEDDDEESLDIYEPERHLS